MDTNLFRTLQALMPAPPLLIGTVTAVHAAAGAVTVQLPGGATLRARGTASVSDRVFVRDGLVQGPAPDLADLTIDI